MVQLWEMQAEELLRQPDVGMVPWALFAQTALPAEELVGQCLKRVETLVNPTVQAGMLAVLEILSGFAFPTANLFHLFEKKPMIILEALESETLKPVRDELKRKYGCEAIREAILDTLKDRFGILDETVPEQLAQIQDLSRLRVLLRLASTSANLAEFLAHPDLKH